MAGNKEKEGRRKERHASVMFQRETWILMLFICPAIQSFTSRLQTQMGLPRFLLWTFFLPFSRFLSLPLLVWLISCVLFLSSLVTFFLLSLYFCALVKCVLWCWGGKSVPLCLVYFVCVLLCICPCFCLRWSTTIAQTETNLNRYNKKPILKIWLQ